MRPLLGSLLALAIATSGCTANDATISPTTGPPAPTTPGVGQEIDGTIWFPPPGGLSGATLVVALDLPAGPATVTGWFEKRWTPTMDAPTDAASAMVRLQDTEGEIHGEAMLAWNGARSGGLSAEHLPAGEYRLVFTLYGWSDGKAMGHHLDYRVTVADTEGF